VARIEPVTDEEREMLKSSGGRRGRIAWAIIKQFEESGLDMARIESDRPVTSLIPNLRSYIKTHKLNLKVSTRRGEAFIIKVEPKEVKELTPEEVDKHD